jgi:DNA-binding CsgD family transcriptional regulator
MIAPKPLTYATGEEAAELYLLAAHGAALTEPEIGELLGISHSRVRQLLARARERLSWELREQDFFPEPQRRPVRRRIPVSDLAYQIYRHLEECMCGVPFDLAELVHVFRTQPQAIEAALKELEAAGGAVRTDEGWRWHNQMRRKGDLF